MDLSERERDFVVAALNASADVAAWAAESARKERDAEPAEAPQHHLKWERNHLVSLEYRRLAQGFAHAPEWSTTPPTEPDLYWVVTERGGFVSTDLVRVHDDDEVTLVKCTPKLPATATGKMPYYKLWTPARIAPPPLPGEKP